MDRIFWTQNRSRLLVGQYRSDPNRFGCLTDESKTAHAYFTKHEFNNVSFLGPQNASEFCFSSARWRQCVSHGRFLRVLDSKETEALPSTEGLLTRHVSLSHSFLNIYLLCCCIVWKFAFPLRAALFLTFSPFLRSYFILAASLCLLSPQVTSRRWFYSAFWFSIDRALLHFLLSIPNN